MKEVKENVAVKCNGINELIACRKKLIEFGFNDGEKWNDKQIKQSVHSDCPNMCFLLIRKDLNNIEVHTRDAQYEIQLKYSELDSYLNKTYNMNNEKFEKLDNEQKELVKYWIEKFCETPCSMTKTPFIDKYLTPEPVIEAGKAYKYPDVDGWMLFVSKIDSDGFVHGYGFDTACLWMDQWEQKHKRELENVVECTKEYANRLIEEAKRIGHKYNVYKLNFNTLFGSNDINGIFYEVMSNGKWADIIDEKADIRESVAKLEAELKELKTKL